MSENDAAHAAALPAPVRGPLLAHAVVFLGFAVIFTRVRDRGPGIGGDRPRSS